MKLLHLGIMKNKELAEWFGIAVKTLSNQKQKRLQELKEYCDFKEVYGGVNILKIYDEKNSYYVKEKSKNYKIVDLAFDEEWAPDGLDTCSNVAIKIANKHNNELTIKNTTLYNYTIQVRNEKYGKPFTIGDLGKCEYLWCKIERSADGTAILTEFTDEQKKIKDKIMTQFFGGDTEKEILVAQMVQEGEISKAEAYDLICELKNLNQAGFLAFKFALEEALGCEIVRGTKIYRGAYEGLATEN